MCYVALFHVMSRGRTTVDRVGFLSFLETLVQVHTSICPLNSLLSCFHCIDVFIMHPFFSIRFHRV